MATQLKIFRKDKAKSATKTQKAAEELAYVMTLNQSITQAMARTMQVLSDIVCINMANTTLVRHDSYLDYFFFT